MVFYNNKDMDNQKSNRKIKYATISLTVLLSWLREGKCSLVRSWKRESLSTPLPKSLASSVQRPRLLSGVSGEQAQSMSDPRPRVFRFTESMTSASLFRRKWKKRNVRNVYLNLWLSRRHHVSLLEGIMCLLSWNTHQTCRWTICWQCSPSIFFGSDIIYIIFENFFLGLSWKLTIDLQSNKAVIWGSNLLLNSILLLFITNV